MKEETVEDLKKRLDKQQAAHANDIKALRKMRRVIDVLIAAGYLTQDRYDRAEALVDDLGINEATS